MSEKKDEKKDEKKKQERHAELKEAFDLFKDDHGKIDKDRLKKVLQALGHDGGNEHFEKVLDEVKTLDYEHFSRLAFDLLPHDTAEEIEAALVALDPKKSGYVPKKQLSEVMIAHGLTQDEVNEILSDLGELDEDLIEIHTFVKMVAH